jgi:hypothetical protein
MREWLVLGAAVLFVVGSPRSLMADPIAHNPPPHGAPAQRDSGGAGNVAVQPTYSPPMRGSPNNRISG